MFRLIHGHHQVDGGHELAETCRWLISRIYILLTSSCVIDYLQHISSIRKTGMTFLKIKMDLQEVGGGCGDWMELAQDRDRWRALVSTVRNLRVPKMRGIS